MIINMLPLYFGFHFNFVADILGLSLQTHCHLHCLTGVMNFAFAIIYESIKVRSIGKSVKTGTWLSGLIVSFWSGGLFIITKQTRSCHCLQPVLCCFRNGCNVYCMKYSFKAIKLFLLLCYISYDDIVPILQSSLKYVSGLWVHSTLVLLLCNGQL